MGRRGFDPCKSYKKSRKRISRKKKTAQTKDNFENAAIVQLTDIQQEIFEGECANIKVNDSFLLNKTANYNESNSTTCTSSKITSQDQESIEDDMFCYKPQNEDPPQTNDPIYGKFQISCDLLQNIAEEYTVLKIILDEILNEERKRFFKNEEELIQLNKNSAELKTEATVLKRGVWCLRCERAAVYVNSRCQKFCSKDCETFYMSSNNFKGKP
ncbi:uncharacterized protein LOC142232348 [Haematobia irritans]|uniref:uncharacterized protein LOC142232348 n=1 Tax=Haematobia irritans TaxID=7368 RepID=UPI003F4FEFD4